MSRNPTPDVIALAGPNGAGKSTVGPDLIRGSLGVSTFVNADVIAQGLSGFAPERAAFAAGRIMLEHVKRLAGRRESFAFETTLSGRTYARLVSDLLRRNYRFHLVFLWLDSPDLAVARVTDRVQSGGHSIPEEVIRRRYRRGLRSLFRLYLPLTTSWRIYDNSRSAAPRLVAAGAGRSANRVLDEGVWTQLPKGLPDED